MRLLVDAQLPPALARWFVSKGHEAIHVFDIEFHRSSDEEIWKFALDNDLILGFLTPFAHGLRESFVHLKIDGIRGLNCLGDKSSGRFGLMGESLLDRITLNSDQCGGPTGHRFL